MLSLADNLMSKRSETLSHLQSLHIDHHLDPLFFSSSFFSAKLGKLRFFEISTFSLLKKQVSFLKMLFFKIKNRNNICQIFEKMILFLGKLLSPLAHCYSFFLQPFHGFVLGQSLPMLHQKKGKVHHVHHVTKVIRSSSLAHQDKC